MIDIHDAAFRAVLAWIDMKHAAGEGDLEIEALLLEAYQSGYQRRSNGCNLVSEMAWPTHHPACVVHDKLFNEGRGFWYSNKMMYRINAYFGRRGRGVVRWVGTTVGGWPWYWKAKREARKNGKE